MIDDMREPYLAERRKHIATPKEKVENTITSAIHAVLYLDCSLSYKMKGRVKNKEEPKRWECILTGTVRMSH